MDFHGVEPKQEVLSSDAVATEVVSSVGQKFNPVGQIRGSKSTGPIGEGPAAAYSHKICGVWKAVDMAGESQAIATGGARDEIQNKDVNLRQPCSGFGASALVAGVHRPGPLKVKAEVGISIAELVRSEAAELTPSLPSLPALHSEDDIIFHQHGQILGAGTNGSPTIGDVPRRPPLTVAYFTVQCVACLKHRWMPNKAVYEFIREVNPFCPFICEDASAWRPGCSCEQPTDVTPGDSGFVWAMDRADIARPPFGWDRKVVIRGEGSVIFSDVYYYAPEGRMLRSMNDVMKYFDDHPETRASLECFNFSRPRPLDKNRVKRKRQEYSCSAYAL